jgi:DNA-binding NarL/FixJ family response regulator
MDGDSGNWDNADDFEFVRDAASRSAGWRVGILWDMCGRRGGQIEGDRKRLGPVGSALHQLEVGRFPKQKQSDAIETVLHFALVLHILPLLYSPQPIPGKMVPHQGKPLEIEKFSEFCCRMHSRRLQSWWRRISSMSIGLLDAYAAVLAGACSVSFLYFGFYLLSPSSKDARFRPLLYTCFFSSAWSICYMLYFLSESGQMRDLYQRFAFAGMLAFVFALGFIIRYTGLIRNKRTAGFVSFVIWLPQMVCVYKSVFENAVARDFPSGFWFLFAEILATAYNLTSVLFMLVYYNRHKTRRTRKYAYILGGSGAVLLLLSWVADYVCGFKNTLNIMPFWLLIWMGILFYTIKKYRFIPITPDFINRDITENIEEGIILLDPDLKGVFENSAARRLLSIEDAGPRLKDEILKLTRRDDTGFVSRVDLTPRGANEMVRVGLKVKRVVDAYNETSGYLAIISRLKDRERLKTEYGITGRELEVISQLSMGKMNKEIAVLLGITEKTIESHIASIYGKLLVKNRVELVNFLSGYDSIRPAS